MKKMLAVGAIAMIAVIMMVSIAGISANNEQSKSNSEAKMADFKISKEGFIDDADKAIRLALVYIHYYGNYEITYEQLTATLNGDVWSISRKGEVVMQLLKSSGAVEHLDFTLIGFTPLMAQIEKTRVKKYGYIDDGFLAIMVARFILNDELLSYDRLSIRNQTIERQSSQIWVINYRSIREMWQGEIVMAPFSSLDIKIRQSDGAILNYMGGK